MLSTKCPKCQAENTEDSQFCKKCATPLPQKEEVVSTKTLETSQEELTTGSIFAERFKIIEELGKGGMGKVYRVLDQKLSEEIALKLIKPEIAADKKTIARFKNELKLARKISHKNVGRMYEFLEDRDTRFITMEYISGQDLKGIIHQMGQLTVGKAISIAKQICAGLSDAHVLGVVHRDLKPNNIMIDRGGNAKIMDFGIAKALKGKSITGSGVAIGTPQYMSPEQVEAKDVDQRSDIYSLGIILYEMLTERVPFEGDSPLTVGVKQKTEKPKDPKDFNERIQDDLNHLILKCLEKEKENRYQSADEVRADLEKIEQGLPTTDRVIPKKKPLTSKEITVQLNLKKILIPVMAVVVIAVIGLIIWSPWKQKEIVPSIAKKPSIAVLPFYDLSPQKDQEYLCDGIATELINRLTKTKKMNVPAQASSFSFKGKKMDVQEIGDKLNVDYVLSGSLQKAENRLRISVELVKVSDGFPIWTEKYERKMEDIFSLQDDISLSVLDNLRIELLGEERAELVTRHTQNLEAYNMFLKGLYFVHKRTADDLRIAIDSLEQAIELDPDYALANAILAESYGLLPFYTYILLENVFTKAKSAVTRALDLDEDLAEAHSALGFIKMYYEWDWVGAEKELKRAIQINPQYVTAHHWYAEYLTWMGRHEEALEEVNLSLELDPLSLLENYEKAFILHYARQYDESIEQCLKTLELDQNYKVSYLTLTRSYLQKGMHEEALKAIQLKGSDLYLEYAYALAGKRDESIRKIEEMKERWKQKNMHALPLAKVYAALEEGDLALDWLDKSFERREPNIVKLNVDPVFDRLRSNPRFKALLKKINLE